MVTSAGRRTFLRAAGAAAASRVLGDPVLPAHDRDAWRVFEVTTRVEVLKPTGPTRIWLPAPLQRAGYQKTLAEKIECVGGHTSTVANQPDGLRMIAAEFPAGVKPALTVTHRVATRDWAIDLTKPRRAPRPAPAELQHFLRPTQWLPTDGIVQQTASEITHSAQTDREKARLIYDWIADNTFRNPKTRGCGRGDIRFMLESKDLGGKCADLNALYVGLARAAGLPARDVYGIRVGKSNLGYACLGPSTENISKAQHCRAEVYLHEYGWVPVDPADVRKVILEEPPGNLPLSAPAVVSARARLFGSWEMNWVGYNYAHDVTLPGSSGPPLAFLMYPQAESAGGRVDSLDAENFRYEIRAKQINPTGM